MSLFDGFRKKKSTTVAPSVATTANASKDEDERFYFENPIEFAIYCKLYASGRNITWISADAYLKEYQKAYQLFEQRQFSKAIEILEECLKLNPIGISARFEICEANLQMHNLSAAKNALLEMKDYLVDNQSIAKFYRRLGFVETESGNYKTAAACYLYSKEFENHPSIAQELMYIASKGGDSVLISNPAQILMKANYPILSSVE